jgi:hypothetical protein
MGRFEGEKSENKSFLTMRAQERQGKKIGSGCKVSDGIKS